MLADVLRVLRCPVCGGSLIEVAGALRCGLGHSYDVARQGYVSLLSGQPPAGVDTPEMVAARADFLAAGHFSFLTDALLEAVGTRPAPGLVLDAGAGTGHHLAAVLDALPKHIGLALDLSKPAVRRAARAHPRAGAAVCDVWRGLPVADGCADVIIDVFAPRNAAEFHRALHSDGLLAVVTPSPGHLAELVPLLGLIGVDPEKDRRLDAALRTSFRLDQQSEHRRTMALTHTDVGRLVSMGPNAWHVDRDLLEERISGTAEPVHVTASITLRTYNPRPPHNPRRS
jgi:23S rRNA (guanine745-N1)-methyltransferase